MTDLPVIIQQQGLHGAPQHEGLEVGTNLIVSPKTIMERLAHLPEDVYNLSAESHLVRLAKVLMGQAGAGRLTTPAVLARLQHSIYGSHFYDLDRFYGALFKARRRVSELLEGDPMFDIHTDEEWNEIGGRDDSYRSRMEQLARAIALGATPVGMELVAEALLNVDCQVYENFVRADRTISTYDDVEDIGTYGDIQNFGTYGELEADDNVPPGHMGRYIFTVVPKRPITAEEHYDLVRVLSILKPAQSILRISPLGLPITQPVPIRSAHADSEYWRLTQMYWTGNQVTPKSRPAWASYQGEAFTHLYFLAGVSSYTLKSDDTIGQFNVFGSIRSTSRTTIQYTPDMGVADYKEILAGRLVSEGVLARNAYTVTRRTLPDHIPVFTTQQYSDTYDEYEISPKAKPGLYIDGYAIYDNAWTSLGGNLSSQRFWATPDRPSSDDTREVLEMKLRSPRFVNYISMELPRFPHQAAVQAWSEETGTWVTLRTWRISESFPQVISSTQVYSNNHPQHSVSGHWQKFSATVDSIKTSRLRVVLRRIETTRGPVDKTGKKLAYSLGLRQWDIGYRIRNRKDIPRDEEAVSIGYREKSWFASSLDAQGKTIVYDVAEDPASNMIDNSPLAWRSEPQPTNKAVVSAFLDVRDEDGNAQLIDKFYIEPSKSGPHMNLYWADTDEFGPFEAPSDKLDVVTGGVVTPLVRGGLRMDTASPSWVEIDNDFVQFDPSASDWSVSMQFRLERPANTIMASNALFGFDPGYSVLFNHDPSEGVTKIYAIGVRSDGGGFYVGTMVPFEAPANQVVTVTNSWSKASETLTLAVSYGDETHISQVQTSGLLSRTKKFHLFGHPISASSGVTILGFSLKVGTTGDDVATIAKHGIDAYTIKGSDDFTSNSVIRFNPALISFDGNEPTYEDLGFRGGSADHFANAVWHPIEREYKLAKGYFEFPPTLAKYWKLEFTNLVPESVESFTPVDRTVKLFPPDISMVSHRQKEIGSEWSGVNRSMSTSSGAVFKDRPVLPARPTGSHSPTAAQYVEDPRQMITAKEASWLFGWQQWQVGSRSPRFHDVGFHSYDEYSVRDTSKIGYFVGIKEISAHRTDYRVDDDTRVYRDHFFDGQSIAAGSTWDQNPNMLRGDTGEVVTSVPHNSQRPVRAIQFAATQSDAVQIIPDDSFQDVALIDNTWKDSTLWHSHGDAVLSYKPTEQAVVISRNLAGVIDPSVLLGVYGRIPQPIVHPVFAIEDDGFDGAVSQASGGIESPLAVTSPRGMIHAAARVTAMTPIVNPLVLQIIGSDGTVLAEEERFFQDGETNEWSVSYHLGSFARIHNQAYETRSIVDDIVRPLAEDGAPVPTGDVPEPAPDELVRVRLIQRGASIDEWKVDRLSIFDDAILWEFSVDGGETWIEALNVRSNPNGVLSFPDPGTSLRWRATAYRDRRVITSLQIRPWYQGQLLTSMSQPNRGPNLSSFDHEPPIHRDPEFSVWHNPVPRWWWLGGNGLPILPVPGQPLTNPYSKFFHRSITEVVPGLSVSTSRTLSANRAGYEGQDDDGFNRYTEVVPRPTDSTSRTALLGRGGSDDAATVADTGHRSILHDDPMIGEIVSPIVPQDD